MKSILLVEDDRFLVDIYRKKLESAGFKTKVAENGEEALEFLKEETPDVLLLDIVLPGVFGWEILKEIKKEPKFKTLKIIILSNLGQEEEVKKGLRLGAAKYLIKSHYTPGEVVEEVKKLLEVSNTK